MKWVSIKQWWLNRQERKRLKKIERLRKELIKVAGIDFRRLQRECDAIEEFFLGKTVESKSLFLLVNEGEYSQPGDYFTSNLGGGMIRNTNSREVTDTSMPHFRPLTTQAIPPHWNFRQLNERVAEQIQILEGLNEIFPDVENNLEVLVEECAEVIQVKAKAFRFGLNDVHPVEEKANRAMLNTEIGQLLAMIDILIANGVLNEQALSQAKFEKFDKLREWYGMTGI